MNLCERGGGHCFLFIMATSHIEKIESRFPTMAELSWGHLKQYLDDHLKKGFSLKLSSSERI